MSIMDFQPRKFWMVSGDGPSRLRHPDRLSAEVEAQRLARANPGTPFFVMEAIAVHRKVDVERIDLGDAPHVDDVPF